MNAAVINLDEEREKRRPFGKAAGTGAVVVDLKQERERRNLAGSRARHPAGRRRFRP